MSLSFFEHLNWRFATKDFDSEKKVSEENLNKILEAIRFAPSSFGFQPYHVYVVGDQELKLKLQEAGHHQAQFADSSHVLVFCSRTDLEDRKEAYVARITGDDEEKREKLQPYINMLEGFVQGMHGDELLSWAHRQTYIALGFALAEAAELEIDSCPMEGFDPAKFDEILEVPEHMRSVVVMSLGYRKHEPKREKFRYPKEDLFTVL